MCEVRTCSECDNEIVIFDKRLIDAGTDEFLSVPAVCLKNKRQMHIFTELMF